MSKLVAALFAALTCLLSACALGDVAETTPLPPITLAPPPALNLVGSCTDVKALETWLQVSSELRDSFQTQMNAAAAKDRTELYTDVLNLAALRDSSFSVATPDCASELGMKLSDAMSQAVTAFQTFVNGDAPNLGNTVVDINTLLDAVQVAQLELITQMMTQFEQLIQPTATAAQ
jgi:hypothetical protein